MSVAALVYWSIWSAMLVVGDPLWLAFGGEKQTDTHFLATHISYGLRIAILAWVAYHFLVAHING